MKVQSSQAVWAFQVVRDSKVSGMGLKHAVGNRNSKNPAMLSVPGSLKDLLKATRETFHPAQLYYQKPPITCHRLGNCHHLIIA